MSQYLIVGDVHGCYSKFISLLHKAQDQAGRHIQPFFLGDLFDRGPECEEMIEYVVTYRPASVMGNHDWKLFRYLQGRNVSIENYPGTDKTLEAIERRPEFKEQLIDYYSKLRFTEQLYNPSVGYLHLVHAAKYPGDHHLADRAQPGKEGKAARARHLYGITTGKTDPETGYPERKEFAHKWGVYKNGRVYVAHGHVVTDTPEWRGPSNNVIDLDTGAAFGGPLTGLTWPRLEIIQSG